MVAPAGRARVCHCSPPEICAYARMLARLRGCFQPLERGVVLKRSRHARYALNSSDARQFIELG